MGVYGKQGEDSVVCLLAPDFKGLRALGHQLGLPEDMPMLDLVKQQSVIDAVEKDVKAECAKGGILRFETPVAWAMVTDEVGDVAWTPDNEMLTAAMKMKRPVIAKQHADVITAMYEKVKAKK